MNNEEKIISILTDMNKEIGEIKTDVREIKSEQQIMKNEIQEIKAEQQVMKADIQEIKAEQQIMKADIQRVEKDVVEFKESAEDTHKTIVRIENELVPLVNAVFENYHSLSSVFKPKVEKLQKTVENLKFGNEIIELVNLVRRNTNNP